MQEEGRKERGLCSRQAQEDIGLSNHKNFISVAVSVAVSGKKMQLWMKIHREVSVFGEFKVVCWVFDGLFVVGHVELGDKIQDYWR